MKIHSLSVLFAGLLASASEGGVLVSQGPYPYSGPYSDTGFFLPYGSPFAQQEADDVVLSEPGRAFSLAWYGFYDSDTPPSSETMRVRFYDVRPGDGLPGSVRYEELFEDPSRVATGRIVHLGVSPHEYRYQVNLTTPQNLSADITYWVEVVQIDDMSSAFRWETSLDGDSMQAYVNPLVGDWRLTLTGADLAFALYSPEPSSAAALAIYSLAILGRRAASRRGK